MFSFSPSYLSSFLLSLCFVQIVVAGHAGDSHLHKRRASNAFSLSKREAASFRQSTNLEKRFDNARFTFFADGLGACGKTNSASDFIVALNSAQYNGGSHCFEMITITVNGKTTQAQITDECPSCGYGDLDFSQGLFDFFASESEGVIYGTWNFGSGDPTTSAKPSSTSTTPTSTWSPTPTTTWTPTSSSSSTWTPTSTSSSWSASSSSSSSSSSWSSSTWSSSSTSSSSASPSATIDANSVIEQFYLALVELGGVVAAGAGAGAGAS